MGDRFAEMVLTACRERCQYCGAQPGRSGLCVVVNRIPEATHLRVGQPVAVCEDCCAGMRELAVASGAEVA